MIACETGIPPNSLVEVDPLMLNTIIAYLQDKAERREH